jgi:hypothetical protein
MRANPGYALGRMAAAFAASQEHPDAETRERAVAKYANWTKVFVGMQAGLLQIGTRTPVAQTPAWATLKVVQGGFATGDLLAEGPLLPYEEELLTRIAADPALPPRAVINSYYLTDAGLAELQTMLATGCYRIDVPEEGALPAVAWLLQHNEVQAAQDVLQAIGPFLHRLRFYPPAHPRPLTDSALVHLQTVGQVIATLKRLQVSRRVQVQREATQVWAPLYDRAVGLFLETVVGPVPTHQVAPDGKPLRGATGQFLIQGGWPCQRYPEGWAHRVRSLLDEYAALRKRHTLSAKPERSGENFSLLRGFLEICRKDPQRLTGRDIGKIRSILAHVVARRGQPDSQRCRDLRKAQAALAQRPTRAELATVAIARLKTLPQDEGLDLLDEALKPITAEEAADHRLTTGWPLAQALESRLRRCLIATVETLIDYGLISSSEVLATVTPQITSQVAAAGLADPDLRRLYGALYQAFRRRRSLLLLNLESQVKFRELPWITPVEAHRERNATSQERARQAVTQIVTLAITAFPQQILPNKLLQEIRALTEAAGIDVPLVEEVAADIFMGAFTAKFLYAAQAAGALLADSLYAHYYDISYARIQQIDDVVRDRQGRPQTSPAFFQLCSERAQSSQKDSTRGYSVAYNGTIIEQEQILTTHNLATLSRTLGLTETLRPRLGDLARYCFVWICRRQLEIATADGQEYSLCLAADDLLSQSGIRGYNASLSCLGRRVPGSAIS